jgi:hypothetical protein
MQISACRSLWIETQLDCSYQGCRSQNSKRCLYDDEQIHSNILQLIWINNGDGIIRCMLYQPGAERSQNHEMMAFAGRNRERGRTRIVRPDDPPPTPFLIADGAAASPNCKRESWCGQKSLGFWQVRPKVDLRSLPPTSEIERRSGSGHF